MNKFKYRVIKVRNIDVFGKIFLDENKEIQER